jgi:two-component system chemotaxis response regulator CheY
MAYRILIVDDSPVMRAFVRRVIELSGFELSACLQASNGREALELLGGETVDVILTDINMPQMDGEEFLRRLAQHESLRAIPVIVISTDATGKRTERMLAMGARGYIAKPFTPEILRVTLERSLGAAHV